MTLSEMIISYRNENSISQRKFAEICGLSNGYISMLEKNINPKTKEPIKPTLQILNKIAKGMNISINKLISSIDDIDILLNVQTNQKEKTAETDSLSPIKQKILNNCSNLSEKELDDVLDYIEYKISQRKR